LVKSEARLFKFGSGTGTNFSKLRSKYEKLSGGGTSSGLMSFLEVLDRGAGATKSGGTTRRAAKMVCLDIDHPEIEDFIDWKVKEEKKVAALIAGGYASDFNGEAYKTVSGQNSNNSVRVSDDFMKAYLEDGEWETRCRTTGEPYKKYRARDLMRRIADAAWGCADPGIQLDTTINTWHTCKNTDRIYASNPCVTGDTLVSTTEGLKPIAELVGKTIDLLAFDGRVVRVSEIFPTGFKEVFELKTASGYTLKLTADHKVWTENRGDVPAKELSPEDKLLLIPGCFGQNHLENKMAEFIGMALGDGCKANDAQGSIIVTMGSGEAKILAEVVDYLNTIKADRKIAGIRHTATGIRTSTSAEVVTSVVDAYAVLDKGSDRKAFLSSAFELDRASTAALLRGLFTTDGTVANYGEKSQYVALDSTSLTLLRQVQKLLLSFGIKSKLYENRRGGLTESLLPDGCGGLKTYTVKEMHSLRISRSSRILFEEAIGFHPKSAKADALRALNASVGTYRDELVDTFESLTQLGTQKVFDLTEPLTHHFVADGLLVHNCSEFMFLDNTACNLASINLMKFCNETTGVFDVEGFRHACRIFILAQEILVDLSSYPTKNIAQRSHDFRPLGLGYANLGTLLMVDGIPYDSDEGRATCAAITAIMHGAAYRASAEIAAHKGAFPGYAANREPMLEVISQHRDAAYKIPETVTPSYLLSAAREEWDRCLAEGSQWGFRNSQVTVLAPTGTIGLLMDCDTTGIEPDFALVKFKKLAGGGYFKIVNGSVPLALKRLGYTPDQVRDIIAYITGTASLKGAPHINDRSLRDKGFNDDDLHKIEKTLPASFDLSFAFTMNILGRETMARLGFTEDDYSKPGFNLLTSLGFSTLQIEEATEHMCGRMTIEGAPFLKPEHLPAFDCANKCGKIGKRFLPPMSHVKMMAAAQPFLSGAISKTINLPHEITVEEIEKLYVEAWKMGLKAVAIYRDGSKLSQPLSTKSDDKKKEDAPNQTVGIAADADQLPVLKRRRLPKKRRGITHESRVGGHKIYLRTGEYEEGALGEIFIDMHKEGAAFRSLMNCFAIAVSLGLQYGVPLDEYVDCFTFTRFEPQGVADHPNVKMATSVIDFVFRVLAMEYLGRHDLVQVKPTKDEDVKTAIDRNTLLKQFEGRASQQGTSNGHGAKTKDTSSEETALPDVTIIARTDRAGVATAGGLQTVSTSSGVVVSLAEGKRAATGANQHLQNLMGDAPFCDSCGHMTVRNGSCYRCLNCGNSMGCS
ncbi:MAG: vitamin B12-dependent ribonucleotide reductase, partial [Deltaproteobacteria bacterium]|nr:vitamin B12-dependent ribonucleotide reductase [Deltaproteobacteria bacterium]